MARRQVQKIHNVNQSVGVATVKNRFATYRGAADVIIDFTGQDPARSLTWEVDGVNYEADFTKVGGVARLTLMNVGATDGIEIDLDNTQGALFLPNGYNMTLAFDTSVVLGVRFVTVGTGEFRIFAEF